MLEPCSPDQSQLRRHTDIVHLSIYFLYCLSYTGSRSLSINVVYRYCLSYTAWSLPQGSRGTRQDTPGHNHTHSHTPIHKLLYLQFSDVNQPTTHFLGQGKESGVPRGNPRSRGRACKLPLLLPEHKCHK